MPRAKPKIERSCLVCDTTFQGTPRATRCDTCRASGHKVPREAQRGHSVHREIPQVDPSKLITKLCGACGEDHKTHKPKATRCQPCIDAGNSVIRSKCVECSVPIINPLGISYNCPSCADKLGIEQHQMTQEQRDRLKETERLEKFLEKRDSHLAWLSARDKVRNRQANQSIKESN